MEAKEFELLLNDLETRVDRLRALYENWFRGYEKMEPQVPRKDVERRVYALRKELPRNTALRFRYHQLYQRYTTLANYWQRMAKQIEEGTHRLQLQRMRRRAGGGPDRKAAAGSERSDPKSYELDLEESLSVDDLLSDFDMDEVARAVDAPTQAQDLDDAPTPIPKPLPKLRPAPSTAEPARVAKLPRAPEGALTAAASVPRPAPPVAAPARPAAPSAPAARAPEPAPVVPAASAPRPAPAVPAASALRPAPAPPAQAFANPTPSATFRLPGKGEAARPQPAPSAAASTASSQRAGGGLNEERLKRIYAEYTSARRRNNEGEVRYENMVSSIQKMLPELQKKHAGKRIDFEVVLKDGRVGLKPRAT